MSAEYKNIDEEQLYDLNNPLNKIIVSCLCSLEGSDEYKVRNIYSLAKTVGFAKHMDVDVNDESAYYIYSSIMCGISYTKRAN